MSLSAQARPTHGVAITTIIGRGVPSTAATTTVGAPATTTAVSRLTTTTTTTTPTTTAARTTTSRAPQTTTRVATAAPDTTVRNQTTTAKKIPPPPPPQSSTQLVLHIELTPRPTGRLFDHHTPVKRFSEPVSAVPLESDSFTKRAAGPPAPVRSPTAGTFNDVGQSPTKKWANPPGTSPKYKLRFDPSVEGVDPMIAVGEKYVVVTQDHAIGFFDKNGKRLPQKNNFPTAISSTDFFSPFIDPSGPLSKNLINNYTGIPADSKYQCDKTKWPPTFPCVLEFYDTRVTYDRVAKRFIILSGARTDKNGTPPGVTLKPENYPGFFAFAVSKSEDPRDGFHMYMSTWTRYGDDYPEISVANKSFVVTDLTDYQDRAATVFWLPDIEGGVDNPRYFVLKKSDVGCTQYVCLTPLEQDGPSNGLTYFLRYQQKAGDPLAIYAFPIPSDPQVPPALVSTSVQLAPAVPGLYGGVYRAGKIYLTTHVLDSVRVPNVQPARASIRVLRIPVKELGDGTLSASTIIADGFLDGYFGTRSADDAPTDKIGYEQPAIAVNKNGDMLIVYGRYEVKTTKPLFQEIRYTLWPHDKGPMESAVLKEGETMLTWKIDGESVPIPSSYRESPNTLTNSQPVEVQGAEIDPSDDTTFWMIHRYAHKTPTYSGWATYVGEIKP